ncbi:MAG: dockerin type I repeat-containing protein [Ruminococcus sp.]|nr:dockerin type I repeat-containing protein [Ruminococcus sp.]
MQHLHHQRKSGKKIFSAVSAFIVSLCFMIPTATMAEDIIYPEMTSVSGSIYDEYRSWSQLDERWGSTPMGGTTIKQSGCLLTSLAIMAVHSNSIDNTAMENLGISDIEQFNPSVLANAYTNVNGFTSGGAIASWGTVHQIIPQIEWGKDAYFTNTEKYSVASELADMMSDGWHVIARVALPYGGFHWVYIEDVKNDGNIVMCDPAKDESDLYTAYPNGLQGEYWILKGTNPPVISYSDTSDKENIVTTSETDEYFLQSEEPVNIYSDIESGSVTAILTKGNVVNISEYNGNYGLIESDDFTGWVDVNILTQTETYYQLAGDINNDGSVDKYDLALLNAYIQQKTLLPDGISILSAAELSAADINCDGTINYVDVISYLQMINS